MRFLKGFYGFKGFKGVLKGHPRHTGTPVPEREGREWPDTTSTRRPPTNDEKTKTDLEYKRVFRKQVQSQSYICCFFCDEDVIHFHRDSVAAYTRSLWGCMQRAVLIHFANVFVHDSCKRVLCSSPARITASCSPKTLFLRKIARANIRLKPRVTRSQVVNTLLHWVSDREKHQVVASNRCSSHVPSSARIKTSSSLVGLHCQDSKNMILHIHT